MRGPASSGAVLAPTRGLESRPAQLEHRLDVRARDEHDRTGVARARRTADDSRSCSSSGGSTPGSAANATHNNGKPSNSTPVFLASMEGQQSRADAD